MLQLLQQAPHLLDLRAVTVQKVASTGPSATVVIAVKHNLARYERTMLKNNDKVARPDRHRPRQNTVAEETIYNCGRGMRHRKHVVDQFGFGFSLDGASWEVRRAAAVQVVWVASVKFATVA